MLYVNNRLRIVYLKHAINLECAQHFTPVNVAVWTLVSATCCLHLTVTSMVGARTVRLMEESSRFPLGACAAALRRVACRWGILPITCVTCFGVGSVRVGVRF